MTKQGAVVSTIAAASLVGGLALMLNGQSAPLQVVTLHGAPQGVTSCTIPSVYTPHTIGTGLCPALSLQTHWKPGDGSPAVDPPDTLIHDLSHTHIQCNFPELGEVNSAITLPCQFVLFHTAGRIIDDGQSVGGPHVTAITFDDGVTTFPLVGDPTTVKTWNVHITFDPTVVSAEEGIQPNGWANFRVGVRTAFDSDPNLFMDTQAFWTIWSTLDPTQPTQPEGEGTRIMLAAKAVVSGYTFGAHLMEFRCSTLPLYAAISAPVQCLDFSYSYGAMTAIVNGVEQVPLIGTYLNLIDNDYHNGLAGNVVDTTPAGTIGGFGSSQIVTFDPVVIDGFTAPAGFAPHVHRSTQSWEAQTPDQPVTSVHGQTTTPGEALFALVSYDVAVGPNPVGCTPDTCPTTAPAPPPVCTPPSILLASGLCIPPPPPPPPPPTPPPPPVIVTTPLPVTGILTTINGVAQPVQLCVGDPTVAANCKPF